MSKVAKKSESTLQVEIEHALGVIKAKTSALPTTHDTHCHLALGDCLIPELIKLFSHGFKVLMSGHVSNGGELLLGVFLEGCTLDVD